MEQRKPLYETWIGFLVINSLFERDGFLLHTKQVFYQKNAVKS